MDVYECVLVFAQNLNSPFPHVEVESKHGECRPR